MAKSIAEKKKLLKTSLFGFNKNDVYNYLDNLDKEISLKLKENENQISSLSNEITVLRRENEVYVSKQQELEKEKALIADTIISAQETANKIIEDAQVEISARQTEFQKNYTVEMNKMTAIQNEIIQLKKFAVDAIRKFEHELSKFEIKNANSDINL